jgi:hypothetical protein
MMTKGVAKPSVLAPPTESVAQIIEREQQNIINEWLQKVEAQPDLAAIPISVQERTEHLPRLLHDVAARLNSKTGAKASISVAAGHHGARRREQGYSATMVIEESRILQVCLFTTLHKNSKRLEFSELLPDVVTIADEVDAQLKQQILCYTENNSDCN